MFCACGFRASRGLGFRRAVTNRGGLGFWWFKVFQEFWIGLRMNLFVFWWVFFWRWKFFPEIYKGSISGFTIKG